MLAAREGVAQFGGARIAVAARHLRVLDQTGAQPGGGAGVGLGAGVAVVARKRQNLVLAARGRIAGVGCARALVVALGGLAGTLSGVADVVALSANLRETPGVG